MDEGGRDRSPHQGLEGKGRWLSGLLNSLHLQVRSRHTGHTLCTRVRGNPCGHDREHRGHSEARSQALTPLMQRAAISKVKISALGTVIIPN